MVPKNMTHLLQPLNLTTNVSMKTRLVNILLIVSQDCITIELDLKLSILKPKYGKVMRQIQKYKYMKFDKGKSIIL